MSEKINTDWSEAASDLGDTMRVEIHNAIVDRMHSPEFQALTQYQQNMLIFHAPLSGVIGAICSALSPDAREAVAHNIVAALPQAFDLADFARKEREH